MARVIAMVVVGLLIVWLVLPIIVIMDVVEKMRKK
jgi:hypothetical protein